MASDLATSSGIVSTAFKGLLLVALGCGFQALMPTVRVSCPARTSAAPDCGLRWLVAFDLVPIKQVPLPGLRPVGEIEWIGGSGRRGKPTLYLDTAAGRVRTAIWGDQMSLQKDLQEPLRAYLADPHASAIALTMRPTLWTDPGGDANDRLVRRTHPVVLAVNAIIGLGLLFWVWLPVQIVRAVAHRMRS
jgi:hypothetical protein